MTAALLLGLGCSKVTSDNYDKIETGMTVTQVEQILGKGAEETGGAVAIGNLSGSAKTVTWVSGEKTITVTFANDKVVMKAKKGF
ncbi:MAG: outer membrane protein assembly factor BamE [Phycisphaerae bacterium]|nr:outer membrane protein assembly factor BamE [Phycisphaerae bacterium]